jgi:hypothetical protein
MAQANVYPISKLLLTVTSTATTATSANFTLPLANQYTFYMNVTTATAGTMDTVFQTSLDGEPRINVPRRHSGRYHHWGFGLERSFRAGQWL